jgi:hypothetical protein
MYFGNHGVGGDDVFNSAFHFEPVNHHWNQPVFGWCQINGEFFEIFYHVVAVVCIVNSF